MMDDKYTLRALQPSDSEDLRKLITEFDGNLTTHFQVDPYQAVIFGTEFRTLGVVVECADPLGIVGMGTVRFGSVQFNGDILPFAFLDGLKVHPDHRGNGLGYQIADWRIQQARQTYGDQCVIGTGMLYDNYASHAVASKWCREFAESAIHVLILPTRTRPPHAPTGITVRELAPQEYEEFAFKQNRASRVYNLNAPSDVASITRALSVSVEGRKPYRYYVAVDAAGNLLAGAQTWARGLLKADTINHLPAAMQLMNRFLHLLPPDHTIRDINVGGLWHEPGQLPVARYLWEAIRWECRDQGTTVTAGFDARDPMRTVADPKPWHQPRPQITFAIHGPAPVDRSKYFYSLGRV